MGKESNLISFFTLYNPFPMSQDTFNTYPLRTCLSLINPSFIVTDVIPLERLKYLKEKGSKVLVTNRVVV